ncbi:MAG TPA: trypsin-like serine protease [Bryobacteraceae bacterium]|nr:trypsin-like serine protease [Bryobacteraceae bacterium]
MIVDTPSGGELCSGSLLGSGMHILTAAHCVTDAAGVINAFSSTITFASGMGDESIGISGYLIHPDWTGDFRAGADLAVLTLARQASARINRYDVFSGANEVGLAIDLAGYGGTGTGATGFAGFDGVRRRGRNRLDATLADVRGRLTGFTAGATVLLTDFDDGSAAHDALGFFGIEDRGLGLDEVIPGPGDSGSPGLTGNRIVGVSSFGTRHVNPNGSTADIDLSLNWSFGELSGFTRVSEYDEWINSHITPIPESGTLPLLATGLCGILFSRYSRRKS